MSFLSMYSEIRGSVPKLPLSLAKTLVNRAYEDIKRRSLWSFQIYESNWISPNLINAGLATAVQGVNTITLDATAAAAVIAGNTSYSPITMRQFRIGVGTIYNINQFDGVNVLTLDRSYQEPSSSGAVAYNLYQLYYPAPYQDHLTFVSIRNMVTPVDMLLDKTRYWLDEQDPQRTFWYYPTYAVFYRTGTDTGNMGTYQYPIFEVWGPPTQNQSYQIYGLRRGANLVNNTDTLPPCIQEDAVTTLAKRFAYEWAEANKGAIPRNQGPDFKYLIGETQARYEDLYKAMRLKDRETVDNFFYVRRKNLFGAFWSSYNTISGNANPGAF